MSSNHKRKSTRPQLVVASTVASVSHTTHDNQRVRTRYGVVDQGTGHVSVEDPAVPDQFWADDLMTNLARESASFSYDLNDESLEAQQDEPLDDGIVVLVHPLTRNTNSVRSASAKLVPKADEYVEENLRREGRGSPKTYARCAGSHCIDPRGDCPNRECDGPAEWCCVNQACFGDLMFCSRCIVGVHAHHPTHFIEQWNGHNFVCKLQQPGLRVQLGHPPGVVCPFRHPAAHDFVLYDLTLTGVHEISVDFCGCSSGPNNDGEPLERRIQLLRACWWPATITAPNMCATFRVLRLFQIINCLGKLSAYDFLRGLEMSTNHDGLDKLPDRRKPFMHIVRQWREVKQQKRAKRGTLRRREAVDPIMGDGHGYFCKRHGRDGYYAHIAKHCIKGLRTTGVAGVTCARHNMWLANGMGDLQVGECQSNMDFVLLACLMGLHILLLVLSYDVACQYAIKFWERMAKMPAAMQLKLPQHKVWWKVPNFHIGGHIVKCRSVFLFHWMRGAGMTTGKGVEQNWAFSNGATGSTRLMGPGSRQATLEDVFGFHNYDRLLAMHRVLPKRLAVAMKDGAQHAVAFDVFTKGLEEARPEEVKKWRGLVEQWETKQHTGPEESPFDVKDQVTSLRAIQLKIAEEEYGTFITMGLEIEETQRRLAVNVRVLKDLSPTQKLAFTKRRTTLLRRICQFREIQRVYMLLVRGVLTAAQQEMYDGAIDQVPEATRLFMPSEISNSMIRRTVCARGLPKIEARMREGEAMDALEAVRHGADDAGPRDFAADQSALLVLEGHGTWEERLRVLKDDDVRALNERALTAEEKSQNKHWAEIGGAIIEGGIAARSGK
ncbi:hypothetical protein B0H14DRAFT_3489073 [Mycena olivaceomarginata]|nr:hypothetical protein B0H14DRAFT_3489073 [Mycena olivaceomarginata]